MNKLDQYLGNPNLKKGHTKTRFTKKQVEEGWASAKSESLEVQTAWKTWAKEKLGETNWNGTATKEF